jgi:hypothetical protein
MSSGAIEAMSTDEPGRREDSTSEETGEAEAGEAEADRGGKTEELWMFETGMTRSLQGTAH